MKIILNKLFLIILFILNVSCKSGSNITDPPPINNSECIDGQSMGCDDICSTTPLQNDVCGECGGDGATCEGNWNVFYDVSIPIKGFEFNIDNVIIINVSGGAAEEANFMITSNTTKVIDFSLSGSAISAGSGILIGVEFEEDKEFACISNLVLSDSEGDSIPAIIENCNTIKYSE